MYWAMFYEHQVLHLILSILVKFILIYKQKNKSVLNYLVFHVVVSIRP